MFDDLGCGYDGDADGRSDGDDDPVVKDSLLDVGAGDIDSEFDKKILDSASHLAEQAQKKLNDRAEASARLRACVDLEDYTVQWPRLAGTWCVI